MLLAEDDSFHIAHLFQFLIQGEQLAFDCSKRQSEICESPYQKKFLIRQARQERFHASAFSFGLRIVKPKGIISPIGKSAMTDYRKLIEEALHKGDLAESFLGMQIILEGLGDVTLENVSTNFSPKRNTFERIRKIILSQEDEHHHFGINYFSQLYPSSEEIPKYLKQRAGDYLALTNEMLLASRSLFEYFEEDVYFYQNQLEKTLPKWVINEK